VNGRPPRRWLAFAAVCVAAVIAYAPSFLVPFQFDDHSRLMDNRALQEGRLLDAVLWLGNSRVVPSLTLVWNYRLGGLDPLGYHIVNFAVHLLATLGVFALALALCRTPRLRAACASERALLLATAAALLFACHPLQTQAITYVIQRYTSMAALFYVWAVVCYLRARLRQVGIDRGRPGFQFGAVAVLGVCAVLSKENAVSLPAALLLAEWVGFGWPRRWRAIGVGVAVTLVVLAVPVVWKTAFWQPYKKGWSASWTPLSQRVIDAILAPRSSPPGGRPQPFAYLLTQATVLPRYFRLVALPWGLNVDHDVPIAHALTPPVVAGAVAILGLVGVGLSQIRGRPLAAFAILWVFVTLSVESSFVPIDDVMVEHRMYLPMAGVAVGAGALFAAAVARWRRVAMGVGGIAAAALVALAFARNVIWLTPVTLWLDAAEKSPAKVRPQTNAGVAYHQVGLLDEAVQRYCKALKLDPSDKSTRDNLAIALEAQHKIGQITGHAVEADGVEGAPPGSLVIEIDPDDDTANTDLAAKFCP